MRRSFQKVPISGLHRDIHPFGGFLIQVFDKAQPLSIAEGDQRIRQKEGKDEKHKGNLRCIAK
jgi:hypothetical protein